MYPGDKYDALMIEYGLTPKQRERVKLYVNESYHQGDTPEKMGPANWKQVVQILTKYEMKDLPKETEELHFSLIDDYKVFTEATKGLRYGW